MFIQLWHWKLKQYGTGIYLTTLVLITRNYGNNWSLCYFPYNRITHVHLLSHGKWHFPAVKRIRCRLIKIESNKLIYLMVQKILRGDTDGETDRKTLKYLIKIWHYTKLQNFTEWFAVCHNITTSVAQEPEGSSQHSQQLSTGPYPEPVESNPHHNLNISHNRYI
jgi:hypothetical protein